MVELVRFRACFLLLLVALLGPGVASAASTLAEAIKAADAKYLDVPDFGGQDNAPKIEAGGSEDDAKPAPQEISQGAVRATLTYREEKREDGEAVYIPIVTISVDERDVARLEGEDIGFRDQPVSIQIAELDPGNPHPEVVVSYYTGGAHCCSNTKVITANAEGAVWSTIDVGEFDGSPLLATDLDGDGRYEIATRDNAFLYAFACYACSEAPLQVIGIENGEVKNLTEEPRFKPAHEGWLKGMIENVSEDDVNGFLAGYVGEKILLGEGKPAWDIMLAHYDKASDWGLESCSKPLDETGECPGATVTLTFPDALEHMLKENGYKVEQ
jgi:hypothetical protein